MGVSLLLTFLLGPFLESKVSSLSPWLSDDQVVLLRHRNAARLATLLGLVDIYLSLTRSFVPLIAAHSTNR